MPDLLIPLGRDAAGILVHVQQVARGLACQCFCPNCAQPLVARQGAVRVWHFAHLGEPCDYPRIAESIAHAWAKQIIAEAAAVGVPALQAHNAYRQPIRIIRPAQLLPLSGVTLEAQRAGYRADLLAQAHNLPIAIEICISNPVSPEKRALIQAENIHAVEIHLSGYSIEDEPSFKLAVLKTAPRTWLHHPFQAQVDKKLQEELNQAAEQRRREEQERRDKQHWAAEEERLKQIEDYRKAQAVQAAAWDLLQKRNAAEEYARHREAIDGLGLGGLTIDQHRDKFSAGPGKPQPCAYCGFSDDAVIPFGVGPWTWWLHEDCWHQRRAVDATPAPGL